MSGFALQVVEEVLQKLLRVIVSDPDPTIRQMLVRWVRPSTLCSASALAGDHFMLMELLPMVVLVLHRSLDSRFDPFLCQVPTYLPISLGPCLLMGYLYPADPHNSMSTLCCRRTTCAPSSC